MVHVSEILKQLILEEIEERTSGGNSLTPDDFVSIVERKVNLLGDKAFSQDVVSTARENKRQAEKAIGKRAEESSQFTREAALNILASIVSLGGM
jgi:F0F1-type ATP synthase epsilon subunit